MRFKIYSIAALICGMALTACALAGAPGLWSMVTAGLMFVFMGLAYRAVRKPMDAVQNGIFLIRSQDFGSRLRLTGQHDADKVVDHFNRMMATMKAERLKNEEQNQFLSKLIEVSPMGIAICDFDGNIIDTNPAYREMATPALEAALSGLEDDSTETFRFETAEIYRCSRLWFMDSGFRRPFLIIERLTDEISKAEKEVFKKIVRTIGHEVNNTMGSVGSVLETLQDIHRDDQLLAETIESSRYSCMNLVGFVKGYAEIVKLPAITPTQTNLAEELRKMLPTLRAMAPENIAITLEIHDDSVLLPLDMMLISRVITNIVKNSIESIGDKPEGAILLYLDGQHFYVEDNGAGIAPEDASRVFTPFFSTKHPDRGLGLMLICEILLAHRSIFSLSTYALNGCTYFSIIFKRKIE